MKRLLSYLAIILALFAVLIVINKVSENANNEVYAEAAEKLYQTTPDKLHSATREQLEDPNYQNIILPEQLSQKLENKEDVFVYFFSPECIHCKETTPKLNVIAQDVGVEIVQFNILEFPEAQLQYNINSWPALVYFKDGVENANSRLVGGFSPGNDEETNKTIDAGYRAFFEAMKLQ